jgi:hypothetical protein
VARPLPSDEPQPRRRETVNAACGRKRAQGPIAVDRNDSDLVDEIAAAIVAYVSTHPNSRDTRRGVGEWWLPPRLAASPSERVDQAIVRLVSEGRLASIRNRDGTILYTAGPVSRPSRDQGAD